MAGDETKNVGLMVSAILGHPDKCLGRWINCEAEKISCRQLVAAMEAAVRSQGLERTIVFEECTMQSLEDEWTVIGNEIGQMMSYIGDVKDRAFENTSGLPIITARELGLELFDTKSFYNELDCIELIHQVDRGEIRLGTVSR
jgi:hypothetical protein